MLTYSRNNSSLNRLCLIVIVHAILAFGAFSLTASISSTSSEANIIADYTIDINNHAGFSQLSIQFITDPNDNARKPFLSNRTIFKNSINITSNCANFGGGQVITCTLSPSVGAGSSQVKLFSMRNPPSTEPYPITIKLNGVNQIVVNLILTTIPTKNNSLAITGMNFTVGKINTNVRFFVFPNGIINSSYILNVTFPSFVTIGLPNTPSSDYTLTLKNNNSGCYITNWQSISSTLIFIIAINNPEAAIAYTINAVFSYFVGTNQYLVEKNTANVQLQKTSYTSLTASTNLKMGASIPTFSVNLVCPFSASSPSLVNFQYPTSQIAIPSCSILNATHSQCNGTSSVTSISLSNVKASIINSVTVMLTTYTTFQGNLYPLCSSYLSLTPQIQVLSTVTVTGCTLPQTGRNNTITLKIPVLSAQTGDIVRIYTPINLIMISTSIWSLNNTIPSTPYYWIILNSTHISTNPVEVTFTYTNPTYITSSYVLTGLTVYRGTLLFAQSVSGIGLCVVDSISQLSRLTAAINTAPVTSYVPYDWTIEITTAFQDYTLTDYAEIQFNNAPNALSINSSSVIGLINGVSASIARLTPSKLRIVLSVPHSSIIGQPSYRVIISSILNPSTITPKPYIKITMFNSQTNTAKQSSDSNAITLSALIPSIVLSPLNLLTSNSISLAITNDYRQKTVGLTSNFQINVPFLCDGLQSANNTNNVIVTSSGGTTTVVRGDWTGGTSNFKLVLAGCKVGYFNASDHTTVATFLESYSGVSCAVILSSSNVNNKFRNSCGNDCYQCDSNLTCLACFNSTYSSINLFYQGQCYAVCPSQSYKSNNLVCISCTSPCLLCDGGSVYNCTSCRNFFTLQANKTCTSVCGANQFYDVALQRCEGCQVSCLKCTSTSSCYQCNAGATLLPTGQCSFTECISSCLTCQNSTTTCTSCISGYILYNFQCLSSCPGGTLEEASLSNPNSRICRSMAGPVLYFPMTILSIVLLAIGIITRCIAGSSRLNLLVYFSVCLAYTELVSAVLLILFAQGISIQILAGIGLAVATLLNILYVALYIYQKCQKTKFYEESVGLDHDAKNEPKDDDDRTQKKKDMQKKKVKDNKQNQLQPTKQDKSKLIQKGHSKLSNDYQSFNTKAISEQQAELNDQKDQKPSWSAAQISLITLSGIFTFRTHRLANVGFISQIPSLPAYFLWVTLVSIVFSSFLLAIAAITQIVNIQLAYYSKLFIGIDAIVVISCSIIVRLWDLWIEKWGVVKVITQTQTAVNHTLENLRTYEEDNQADRYIGGTEEFNDKSTQKVNNTKSKLVSNTFSPGRKTNAYISPKKPVMVRNSFGQPPKQNSENPTNLRKTVPSPSKQAKKNTISDNNKEEKTKKSNTISDNNKEKKIIKSNTNKDPSLTKNQTRFLGFTGYTPKSMVSPYNVRHRYFGQNNDKEEEIPDVKIFDTLDMEEHSREMKAQKLKKWNINSSHNYGSRNFRSSTQVNKDMKKQKRGWKLDDIYLGFVGKEDDSNPRNEDFREDSSDQQSMAYLRQQLQKRQQLQDVYVPDQESEKHENNLEDDPGDDPLAMKERQNLDLMQKVDKRQHSNNNVEQKKELEDVKQQYKEDTEHRKQPQEADLQERSNRPSTGRENKAFNIDDLQ